MFKLHPIDTLIKIIVATVLWFIADAIGNVFIVFLIETVERTPTPPEFIGLEPAKIIFLIALNCYIVYKWVKDIAEFVEEVKSSGFRIF